MLVYGTSTALTFHADAQTMADGASHSSAAVETDTSVNTVDYLFQIQCAYTGTPVTPSQLEIFIYSSEDGVKFSGNSSVSDDVDGTAKALSSFFSTDSSIIWVGPVPTNSTSVTSTSQVFSLVQKLGCLPRKWGIVVKNEVGVALTSLSASITRVSYT